MVESLKQLGNNVVGRYKTLENNIKCRSNSFYDSYLDLLELTYKTILTNEDIGYFGRTCGEILKEPDVINFFLHIVKMDKAIYEKSKDYIAKINKHKHHNEKYINLDAVLSYISLYFSIVKSYYDYKHYEFNDFDIEGIRQIYGITQKRSDGFDDIKKDYKEMTDMVKTELSSINKKIDLLNPDEKKKDKLITRDFYYPCKKSYLWDAGKKKMYLYKALIIVLCLIGVGFAVVSSFYSSKFYANVFYLSYILHCLVFVILILDLASISFATFKTEGRILNKYSILEGKKDEFGAYYFRGSKNIYMYCLIFGEVYLLTNTLYSFTKSIMGNKITWIAFAFSLLSMIIIYVIEKLLIFFFKKYDIMIFEGLDKDNKAVTYIYDLRASQSFTLEDYKQKYPYLF